MKKIIILLLTVTSLAGCGGLSLIPIPGGSSGGGGGAQILSRTTVSLSKGNYNIVKTSAAGESWGVNLLGLIPVKTPYLTEAMAQVYEQAGEMEGKPRALANIVYQQSSNFYLLFSIPKITVRADVVEFAQTGQESGN